MRSIVPSAVAALALASWLLMHPAVAQQTAAAQKTAAPGDEEQAIRATAKAYFEALAKGDPKALAEFWTADGDYIDDHGQEHPVGELVAEAAQAASQNPRPGTKVTASKIRFLTADVAIEEGASEVEPAAAGLPPIVGHFQAVWAKKGGRWRLASLAEIAKEPASDARLADWNWMIGHWTAQSGDLKLEASVQRSATGTFLLREITALVDDKAVLHGWQRIGRDPLTGKLKSWSFDSNGGYDEATWTKDGDAWLGQATGVSADGRRTSSTTVISCDGHDSYTRKVLANRIEGQPAPDEEMTFTRQAPPELGSDESKPPSQ